MNFLVFYAFSGYLSFRFKRINGLFYVFLYVKMSTSRKGRDEVSQDNFSKDGIHTNQGLLLADRKTWWIRLIILLQLQ